MDTSKNKFFDSHQKSLISEMEEIKRQAKEIIDSFARALDKAGIKETESRVERKEDRRVEGEGGEADSDFREIMFENAPEKENDFIVGEKKKWE